MTIYFDINEQPYNTPVEGYIASCTDSQWAYYSQRQNRDKYKLDSATKQLVDITDTEEYKAKQLIKAKEDKAIEIKQKNKDKYSLEGQTITVELPAVLKKGEETKQVQSFKLLTVTSAGQLATVLTGYVILAQVSDIPDLLNDDNGYTIVGLNELVNGQKFINLIFAKVTEAFAKITGYQRYLLGLVDKAMTIEEVQGIYVDFDNIPVLEQTEEPKEEEVVENTINTKEEEVAESTENTESTDDTTGTEEV